MSKWLETRNGQLLVVLARFVVGGVFIFAAVPKIADPHAFAVAVSNYHLVPDLVSRITGAALPPLELLMGVALVTGVQARGAAVVSVGLLVFFAIALTRAMLLDINVDCGCFGSAARAKIGWDSVARNTVLSGLGALVIRSPDVRLRGLFKPKR